jgi:hypothetical protein
MLWQLWALHFLCDFPLQGDFLARAKNHLTPIPGVYGPLCLFAHAFIQAAAVALILPLPYAGCELVTHLALDVAKNEGVLGTGSRGFIVDQLAHLGLKVAYVGIHWWLA